MCILFGIQCSPACRARVNALVRADCVASGTKTPGTPAAPPTPAAEPVEEYPADPEIEPESFVGVDAADLPFSAGIPPGSSEAAMIGKKAFVLDDAFVDMIRSRNMARRVSSLSGRGMLYEYACSDTSIIGEKIC